MNCFVKHVGAVCPVRPDAQVIVRLEGDPAGYAGTAGEFAWGLEGQPGRIADYAVVESLRPNETTPANIAPPQDVAERLETSVR